MKRALLILALYVVCALRCEAQFIGYVIPQTVQKNLATAVACTGVLQNFLVPNLGQTTHVLQWVNSPASVHFEISLLGSTDGSTFFTFSDVATTPSGILQATGYYPAIEASVVCTVGSTFTVTYQGTSTFALQPNGFADRASAVKTWAAIAPAGVTLTQTITVPYGSSGGLLYFNYSGDPGEPAGSTIIVTSSGLNVAGTTPLTIVPAQTIAQNAKMQAWIIPAVPTVQISIKYTTGGASAQTFNGEVQFFKAGQIPYSADPCKFAGLAAQIPNCPTLP